MPSDEDQHIPAGNPIDNEVEHSTYPMPPYAHTTNGGAAQYAPVSSPSASGAPIPTAVHAPEQPSAAPTTDQFDYTYIYNPARIAIYDSLSSAPRIIQIDGAPTHEYIEHIASLTFKYAKEAGGRIPYTVIREVSENFIHARFAEVIVSILDDGNTIRFADQGPGITQKEMVQEPGFSSATEPMKRYIRGVGSGLPIVKDYLDMSHGYIEIEDNINRGSVVTISLVSPHTEQPAVIPAANKPSLTENEEKVLKALLPNLALGVTEVNRATGVPVASIHTAFSKMEQMGLVEKINKKRALTPEGHQIAVSL